MFSGIRVLGDEVTSNLFGGNILAYRQEMLGEGQYEEAVDHLGITDLRYPGGSTTEYYFDIYNPDSSTATHSVTGQVINFIPISEFMEFAGSNEHAVTLVVPTRHSLSDERDENGHRLTDIDEESYRTYVRDVITGKFGNAEVRAFEIGNEYWLSGGMDSVEYGRVAAEITDIIDDELMKLSKEYPNAEQVDIVVQMGKNFGSARLTDQFQDLSPDEIIEYFNDTYGLKLTDDALYPSGKIDLTYITNKLIIAEFEKADAIEDVDGVVAHVYSLGELNTWSKVFELQAVSDTWQTVYPDLDTYVTEWNMKGVTELLDGSKDYGLYQATEMLNIVEEFVKFDVDFAHVWPLIQHTDNALNRGSFAEEPSAPGEMFSLMAKILPGKVLLDFVPADNFKTEAEFDGYDVHGFVDESEIALFMTTSHKEGIVETNLDISELIKSYGFAEISILGVADGHAPGDNDSHANVEVLDPEAAIVDGFIDVPLDPGEILVVRLFDYVPTASLAAALGVEDEEDEYLLPEEEDEDDFIFPTAPVVEENIEKDQDDDSPDVDDGSSEMLWLLALVPLALLFGMA